MSCVYVYRQNDSQDQDMHLGISWLSDKIMLQHQQNIVNLLSGDRDFKLLDIEAA